MKYRYLLIDNDNTLMDFHAAEHAALREALTEAGIEPTDAVCARYSAINDALWKALERGETTHAALKIIRFAPPKTSARPALPCVTATISARTLTSCPARRRFCAACTGR